MDDPIELSDDQKAGNRTLAEIASAHIRDQESYRDQWNAAAGENPEAPVNTAARGLLTLTDPNAAEMRGYIAEGKLTTLGMEYDELFRLGILTEDGQLTPKGKVFTTSREEAVYGSDIPLYKARKQAGLDDTDTPFLDTVGSVAGLVWNGIKGLKTIGDPSKLFTEKGRDEKAVVINKAAESWLGAEMVLASGANMLVGRPFLEDDSDEEWSAWQEHERIQMDVAGAEMSDAIAVLATIGTDAEEMEAINARAAEAAQREKTLGPELYAELRAQGEGVAVVADPQNFVSMGAGAAAGAATKAPLILRASRTVIEAAGATQAAIKTGANVAKLERLAARAVTEAGVVTDPMRQAGLRNLTARIAAELPAARAAAESAATHAAKLSKRGNTAEKLLALNQAAQELKALPVNAAGKLVERTGSALVRLDDGVNSVVSRLGLKESAAAIRTLGGAGVGALMGGPAGAIGGGLAALKAGKTIRGIGQYLKVVGPELMEARGTVPFWQRVAQNVEGTVPKVFSNLMDTVEMASKPLRKVARGTAGAAPVDFAFNVIASGGDITSENLKQSLAESVIFGGAGGLMTLGSKKDLAARSINDELNLRAILKDEQKPLFDRMGKGPRRAFANYQAAFPSLRFDFDTDPAKSSSYDPNTNTIRVNPLDKDGALDGILAHEITHFITTRGGMNEGIVAMLIGDGASGGLVKAADGTLSPDYREFRDAYRAKEAAAGIPEGDERRYALEYFTEAAVDHVKGGIDTGRVQRAAGQHFIPRVVRDAIARTLPRVPILGDLIYRIGGATDRTGAMVQGNGLLADGIKEIPGAKRMIDTFIREKAGRRGADFTEDPAKMAGIPSEAMKDNKPLVESLFGSVLTDKEGNPVLDAAGHPQELDKHTHDARAQAGLKVREIYAKMELENGLKPGEGPTVSDNGEWHLPYLNSEAITTLAESGIWNNKQLSALRMINNGLKKGDGQVFNVLYNATSTRLKNGKLRYASLPVSYRDMSPYAVSISKAGQIVFKTLSLDQVDANVRTRANYKSGKRLYQGDIPEIFRDTEAYLDLHKTGTPTLPYFENKYPGRGEQYQQFINSIFGLITEKQRSMNPIFDSDQIPKNQGVIRSRRLDRINKTTRIDGKFAPFRPNLVETMFFPNGAPETIGLPARNPAESTRANRPENARGMEDSGPAQGAIPARELVPILSPDRSPPTYGQVFQPDAEIKRQWGALTSWAKDSGVFITPEGAKKLRKGDKGGGEEHFVYFDEVLGHVVKETRPDSWANKATAGQYFQRWKDIGKLWPALEPEVIGVSDGAIFTRQKFIDGDVYENRADLMADMKTNGWEPAGYGKFRHEATGAVIGDARPSNVIRGRDGTVWPFDVIVESTGNLE